MSVNKCIFIGNMGHEAEIKTTEYGIKVAQFSIACTERGYIRSSGQQVPDRTEWIPVVAWRGLADTIEKYTRKGSKLYVEGHFTTRKYETKKGDKRVISEIIADTIELLDPRRSEQPLPQAPSLPENGNKLDYEETKQ